MAEIKLNKNHPLYIEDLKYVITSSGLDEISGKSFLVTGATGLIGTCLIDALMLNNSNGNANHVYAVGRDKQKAKSRLGEYYTDRYFHFIEQDVRTPLPSSLDVDYIIPLASNTHPMAYSQYPVETIEINVKGAESALKLAERCVAIVLYPSTVEVYGNARGKDVFNEDYTGDLNLKNSRSCYPESKRLCEALCQSYMAEHNVEVKIVRLSRIIGPTMQLSDTKASSQFIIKALSHENIVLKSKGEQYFSYTYVSDAVSAILYVLFKGRNGEAYNIANSNCDVKLKDFANMCADWSNRDVVFDLPSDIEKNGYSVAMTAIMNSDKLRSLGFESKVGIKEAVNRLLSILWNDGKN